MTSRTDSSNIILKIKPSFEGTLNESNLCKTIFENQMIDDYFHKNDRLSNTQLTQTSSKVYPKEKQNSKDKTQFKILHRLNMNLIWTKFQFYHLDEHRGNLS